MPQSVQSHIDSLFPGKYLRRNPLARAGFIFYLIMIHLWSIVILFFHAHSFQEHGDFGAGVGIPHGPHALMMQHQLLNQDIFVNADASGTSLVSNGEVPHKNDSKSNKRNEVEKRIGEAMVTQMPRAT